MTCALSVETWDRLRRELVWIRRAPVDSYNRHNSYRPQGRIAAWRFIRGSGSFRLASGRCKAVAGQWIIPGVGAGENLFTEDAEIISVRFHVEWPGGENLFDHRDPIVIGSAAGRSLDEAGFALVDFVQGKLSPQGFHLPRASIQLDQYLTLQTHFDRWVRAYVNMMTEQGRVPRAEPRVDARILEAMKLMESRLRASEVMLENDVARAVGLSLSQFKRLFGRDLKKSPKSWLDDLRYELACDRLGETNQTVKQIGYELGFRSPNHFSSWFAKHRGSPPSQARRSPQP